MFGGRALVCVPMFCKEPSTDEESEGLESPLRFRAQNFWDREMIGFWHLAVFWHLAIFCGKISLGEDPDSDGLDSLLLIRAVNGLGCGR